MERVLIKEVPKFSAKSSKNFRKKARELGRSVLNISWNSFYDLVKVPRTCEQINPKATRTSSRNLREEIRELHKARRALEKRICNCGQKLLRASRERFVNLKEKLQELQARVLKTSKNVLLTSGKISENFKEEFCGL